MPDFRPLCPHATLRCSRGSHAFAAAMPRVSARANSPPSPRRHAWQAVLCGP